MKNGRHSVMMSAIVKEGGKLRWGLKNLIQPLQH